MNTAAIDRVSEDKVDTTLYSVSSKHTAKLPPTAIRKQLRSIGIQSVTPVFKIENTWLPVMKKNKNYQNVKLAH